MVCADMCSRLPSLLRILFRRVQTHSFQATSQDVCFYITPQLLAEFFEAFGPHGGCDRWTYDTACACSPKKLRFEACCVHDAGVHSASLAPSTWDAAVDAGVWGISGVRSAQGAWGL